MTTPLEATTEKILSAIALQDLPEVNQSIKERAALLAAGAEVTPRAWELGDRARSALISLKRNLTLESARLQQIRQLAETLPQAPSAHREYFG